MLSRVRSRMGFANVTSAIALFIALGGTSYAAISLPSNSVDSREIRSGAVGKSEIRKAAAGKSELRARSVSKSEIRAKGVGKSELRGNAVGASEIRKNAVDTTELKDGGIGIGDISPAAQNAIIAKDAVTFRAAVTSTGAAAGGNAKAVSRTAAGTYSVDLGRDVTACQISATLAAVKNAGGAVEPPTPGLITAAADGTKVTVKALNADGTALDSPFHLLVAC